MSAGAPFEAREVIFAPTAACNLHCGHCRVDRRRGSGADRLTIEAALRFLGDCADHGIERVGFSGGEPFLESGFVAELCAAAVERGMYFDRLMTNAAWYRDEGHLEEVLERIYDAGFDGTVGISIDDWHAQEPKDVALFIETLGRVAGRFDGIELACALDREGRYPLERLAALAKLLGCDIVTEGGLPAALENSVHRKNLAAGMDDGQGIFIPVTAFPYSRGAGDAEAWKAAAWFTDDFCSGPGNVFFVHPDGSVAPCCGFANERPDLILGKVEEGVEALTEAARNIPAVRRCYETGLDAYRRAREAEGIRYPGKTDDPCFFCDWLCERG